jgi:hypothetical protein
MVLKLRTAQLGVYPKCRINPIFLVATPPEIVNKIVVSSEEKNYSKRPRLCGNPNLSCRAYESQKLFVNF